MTRSSPTPQDQPRGRDRLRALLVVLLLGSWFLRWTGTRAAIATGPDRTGWVALSAILVLWGLALTRWFGRSPEALRRGVALTDATLALVTAVLLLGAHVWIPGGPLRAVVAPVFAPLGLLALLDAWRPDDRLSLIRALAAAIAAALLLGRGANGPGFVLLWLALSPAVMVLAGRTPFGWAWGTDLLLLVASTAAFFAPELNAALGELERATGIYEGRFAWQVIAAALALLSLVGVLWPVRTRRV